jgi:catechol 2,3-dioxygenase-like lactoylglutathione lyase family enzyme
MNVQHLSPILNVRDLVESFAWFEKLGWSRDWDFGDPPDFGSVRNGDCDIFLCKDGQGSRDNWIYVRLGSPAEIDSIHARAQQSGVVVIAPPADMPWNAREVHVRHPDGHTLRIGAQIEQG